MKMKKKIIGQLIITITVILILSCDNTSKNKSQQNSALSNLSSIPTNPAMTNPDKFAWDLFMELNQPSGENPKMSTWETWALARCVFNNPDVAPLWETVKEKNIEDLETLPLQQLAHLGLNPKVLFDPKAPTRNETRMNRTAFDFIVENKLFSAEGLEDFYAAYPAKMIDLPVEAREIKALWDTISVSDTSRYHFAVGNDGQTYYGLKGIHIITKDIPNWFWTTFEHIDNFDESEEYKKDKDLLASRDSYGYDARGNMTEQLKNDFIKNKMANKWKYYRLRGTQTDFTDAMGKPIVLANSRIEDGFMLTSSCMTCHARATVGALTPDLEPQGIHQYNRLSIFKFTDGAPGEPGVIGAVNPGLYFSEYSKVPKDTLIKTSKPKYIQTDFMWSFFRAKRKGTPPANNCR